MFETVNGYGKSLRVLEAKILHKHFSITHNTVRYSVCKAKHCKYWFVVESMC